MSGYLHQGEWIDDDQQPASKDGHYRGEDTVFRGWVSKDASMEFQAETERYHLYVSYACPWASRTLVFRELKKLKSIITVCVVDPCLSGKGWMFSENDCCGPDYLNHSKFLYEIYLQSNSRYTGRVTVPVLWDKKTRQIVSNDSADIIRMFNSEFNHITGNTSDYYPVQLREEIDVMNEKIDHYVNNGVYRCGFASTQSEYQEAVINLFNTLDELEEHLSINRYLIGDQITEADWRLFVTLVRFDAVYNLHFKCNLRRIEDYPALQNYTRYLYQIPGISSTVHLAHIRLHYYKSHQTINPRGIVPIGPEFSYLEPHNRV